MAVCVLSGRDTVPALTNDGISISVSTVDGVIALSTAGFFFPFFFTCVFLRLTIDGRVGSGWVGNCDGSVGLSVGRLGWWKRLRNGLPIQPSRDSRVGQVLCCVLLLLQVTFMYCHFLSSAAVALLQ